ncbi:hypothetical protein KUTeg_016396 [Tegillarca granosa]|uniref:HAUS augmin-like complex subunit 3 N-terminal domain-containing protein n=1 Tax=Tegillarca granosa TaxID=220873 RepID=A0ABQ9EN91_TEGGR|nr:hypothetical protein KUTeg_016396 [Tegillarca granosa]
MSGRQFIDTLKQLGYPKADTEDPNAFDWMFENEAVFPFLEWFCNNVSSANVIDLKDIEAYNELVGSQEGVLDGRQLEEALKTFTSVDEETVTEDMLRKDIETLSRDLHIYKKRKQSLIRKRNKLSLHHTAVSHRRSELSSIESKIKLKYKKCLEQSQADSNQINSTVEKLAQSVTRASELYRVPQNTKETDETTAQVPMFLSQISLDDYTASEEKFRKELAAYTRKQFFEGIAEMAGQEEGSQYEFLEISDPNSLLVRGEREHVNLEDCKELARIQAFYPKSESKRIEAMLNSKQAGRCLRCAEDILQSLNSGTFGRDINDLSKKLQDNQTSLESIKRDMMYMLDSDVPQLIRENTASQVSRILTGDYNLKLSRQDYFVSKQDQKMMDDPALTAAKHQRGTIDSRDKFTSRLYNMLVDADAVKENKHLFLSYTNLIEEAENLEHCCEAVKENVMSDRTRKEDRIDLLEQNLRDCENMVYDGSSTTGGQPTLTPRQLLESMTQLDDMLQKLEHAIKDIVKEVDSKKQALKSDPLLNKERNFFTYFFTNPPLLGQTLDAISARLQAQKIH